MSEAMFAILERLYKEEKLSEENLDNAIKKGWITKEQNEKIVKEKQN